MGQSSALLATCKKPGPTSYLLKIGLGNWPITLLAYNVWRAVANHVACLELKNPFPNRHFAHNLQKLPRLMRLPIVA